MTATIATDPANGKPVRRDPHFAERDEWYEPGVDQGVTPAAASWDLGYGACLSCGAEEDGGPLVVHLNVSDYTKACGVLTRTVTREQLVAHAEHLLKIAGARTGVVLDEVAS